MTKRNEHGDFVSQGPHKFNSDSAKEVAEETAWDNHRKQILKKYPLLWEEFKDY